MVKTLNSDLHYLQELALKHKSGHSNRFSLEQKRMIVEAVLQNKVSKTQLSEDFGVSRVSIWRWISNFANGNASPSGSNVPKEVIHNPLRMPRKKENSSESPEQELARLREENKKLQEALKMSEWSNHAKDVMIELAEKTFNIPIRKKSGAKQ